MLLAAVLAMAIGSVAQSGHFSLDTPDEPGTETPDNPGGDTETGDGTGDGTDTGETTSPSLPVEEGKWYRLQCPTRDNRVIELIAASSPLIGTGESDPHIDRLWSNAAAATNASNYNYQLWHFEPDPENSGYFAMVNYSDPNGSVVLTPIGGDKRLPSRWDYDHTQKHYNFEFNTTDLSENQIMVRSTDCDANHYMFFAGDGRNYAINCYDQEQSRIITFVETEPQATTDPDPDPAPELTDTTRVCGMDLSLVSCGDGRPKANKCITGQELKMLNVVYDHGVGTHAASIFNFLTNGATSFHAVIGISDYASTAAEHGIVKVTITRYANGVAEQYGEPFYLKRQVAEEQVRVLDIPLEGYEYLKIDIATGDATVGTQNYADHVNLADAYFTGGISADGTRPSLMSYNFVPLVYLPATGANGETVVPLSSMVSQGNMTSGWGGHPCQADQSVEGRTLLIRGRGYASGVGTHANSKIVVKLNGNAKSFHAIVGIDDEADSAGDVNWTATLLGPNGASEVAASGNSTRSAEALNVDIDNLDQGGWKYLVLNVDANGSNASDHFDWANAYFLCDGEPIPKTVAANTPDNDWELRDCPDAEVSNDPLRPLLITSSEQMSTNVPDGVGKLCYLIDGNTVTYWESPNVDPGDEGQWIQVDLGKDFTINDEDLVVRIRRCRDNASMAPTAFEVLASADGNQFTHWAYTYFVYRGPGTTEYSARLPLDDNAHPIPSNTRYLRFRVTANQTKTLVTRTDGTVVDVRRMRLSEFNILRLGHDTGYSATQWDRFRLNSDYLMDYYDAKFRFTQGPVDPRNHPSGDGDYGHFQGWGSEKDFGTMSAWCNPIGGSSSTGWSSLYENGKMVQKYADALKEAGINVPSYEFVTTDYYDRPFEDEDADNRHRQPTHVMEHELYAIPGDAIALYPFYTLGTESKLSYDENYIHWYDYHTGGNAGGYLDMLVDPSRVILTEKYGYFAGAANITANPDKPANPLSSYTYGWKDTQRSETAITTGNLQDNGQATKAWGRIATFFVPRNPFDESSLKGLDKEYVIAADFSSTFRDVRNVVTTTVTDVGTGAQTVTKTIVEPVIHYRHIFRIKDGVEFANGFSGSPEANEAYIALNRRKISAPAGQDFEVRLNNPMPKEVTTRSRLYYKISESDYRRVCSMMLVATDSVGNEVQRSEMVDGRWQTEGETIFIPEGQFDGYGSRVIDGVTYNACGGGGHYYRVLKVNAENAHGKYRVTLYGRDYNGARIRIFGGGDDDYLKVQEIDVAFVGDTKAYFKTVGELTDGETGEYVEKFAHTTDSYLRELCGSPKDSINFDNYNLLRTSLAANDEWKAFIGENGTGNSKISIYKWPLAWDQSAYGFGYPLRGDWNYYTVATNSRALRYAQTTGSIGVADNFGKDGCTGLYDRRFYDSRGEEQGFFYYVNASADPGVVARLKLEEFCPGSTIYVTAWIAEMSSNLGDRANVAFNFVAVVKKNGRQVRIPLHSHISGIYPYKGKSEWMRVYFSFVPDINNNLFKDDAGNFIKPDHYELELDNNAKGSSGADYAIDDIRVYIANPLVYAEHSNPSCDTQPEQTKVKVSAPFDVLLQSVGKSETTSTSESVTLYYTFVDKALFKAEYEKAKANPETKDNAAAVAYSKSVCSYIHEGDAEAKTFGHLTFSTGYDNNTVYSADGASDAGMREVEDGERLIVFNTVPRSGDAPLVPGKEYTVYLFSPSGKQSAPTGNPLKDATTFNVGDEGTCAQTTTFIVRSASTIHVDDRTVNTGNGIEMCAGQQPVVSVDLLGEVLNADGTGTGEFVPVATNARVDWFDGTLVEFKALDKIDDADQDQEHPEITPVGKLTKAIRAFHEWNPEAQNVPETRPSEITVENWKLIDEELRPLTLPDGAKMPRLRLAQRFYTFSPLEGPTVNPDGSKTGGEYSVLAMPYQLDIANRHVCTAPTLVKISVVNDAPQLELGHKTENTALRPALMHDVTVRVGLEQLKKVSNTTERIGKLTSDSTRVLRLPVYLTRTVTDGCDHVVKIADDPEIYFIGTDDPAYNPDLRHPDARMFDLAGRVIDIRGYSVEQTGANAKPDSVRLAFYDSFKFREGYTYRFRFGYKEEAAAASGTGGQPSGQADSDTDSGTGTGSGTDDETPGNTVCDGNTYFNINVVPEYVMWTGNDSRNWNNDRNWRRVTSSELLASSAKEGKTTDAAAGSTWAANATEAAFAPDAFTKVIIPAATTDQNVPYLIEVGNTEVKDVQERHWIGTSPETAGAEGSTYSRRIDGMNFGIETDLGVYCEGEDAPSVVGSYMVGNQCEQIHFKPASAIMNQQHLDYKRAWVDMEFDPRRWFSLAAPLYGVVSGEMYAPTAGGRQNTELFNDITFSTDLHNRFAPAIYQRSWNAATANLYMSDKVTPSWERQSAAIVSRWSHVYNDANVSYGPGSGFSIKADVSGVTGRDDDDKVLIRLPKADTEYRYYHHDGAVDGITSGHDFAIEHNDNHYKLNDASKVITVTAEAAGADNKYFLLGNPYMSYLDMGKFLAANEDKLEQKFWVLSGNGKGAMVLDASNSWTDAAGTTVSVIPPMQGFFVELKQAAATGVFTFNSSMMADVPAGGGQTPLTDRGASADLLITAVSSGAKALVAVRDASSANYEAKEDAALFTDPDSDLGEQVYTLAGNVAAEVNAVPEIEGLPLGVVAETGAEVVLRFDNVPDGLMLYDVDDDRSTLLAEGAEAAVTQGHRTLLTFSRGDAADKVAPGLTLTLVGNRAEAVTDAEGVAVEVYDTAGRRLDRRSSDTGRMTVTLPAGTVIVRATDVLGRTQSGTFYIPEL